jgi:hypothetical protein
MKKLFSISLVFLLMLNVLGYYGVFLGLQYKNTRDLSQRLDADDYNEDEAITIKVQVAIPYMTETGYERVKGEIEYNGEFYSLIKQKLANDTLFIVCIRNHERKEIKNALSDYVKTFSDKTSDDGNQAKTIPSFIKDFLPTEISLETSVAGWIHAFHFGHFTESAPSLYLTINSPPPRV